MYIKEKGRQYAINSFRKSSKRSFFILWIAFISTDVEGLPVIIIYNGSTVTFFLLPTEADEMLNPIRWSITIWQYLDHEAYKDTYY